MEVGEHEPDEVVGGGGPLLHLGGAPCGGGEGARGEARVVVGGDCEPVHHGARGVGHQIEARVRVQSGGQPVAHPVGEQPVDAGAVAGHAGRGALQGGLGCGAHLGVLHVAAGGRQAVVRLRVGGAQRSLEVGLDRYVEQGDDGVPSLLGVRPVERGRFEVSLQRTNVVDPFGGQAHALHRCGDDVGEEGLPGGPSAIGGGPAHPRRLDDLLEADVVHGHGEPAFADLVERALQ